MARRKLPGVAEAAPTEETNMPDATPPDATPPDATPPDADLSAFPPGEQPSLVPGIETSLGLRPITPSEAASPAPGQTPIVGDRVTLALYGVTGDGRITVEHAFAKVVGVVDAATLRLSWRSDSGEYLEGEFARFVGAGLNGWWS